MKKFYLLPALALLLGACSNDTNLTSGPENPGNQLSGQVTGYVNVQIVMPGSINSRAAADDGYNGSYDKGPGTYLDGTAKENKVNSVRFYFFDDNGNAVDVRKNPNTGGLDYFTYIDWVPAASEMPNPNPNPDHDNTIEQQYTTTLVLSQPKDAKVAPTRIVAIINPPTNVVELYDFSVNTEAGKSDLAYLAERVEDYITNYKDENFVMSNSVYVGTDGSTVINYAEITGMESNVTPPADQPQGVDEGGDSDVSMASATIYVERVAARVDFSINLNKDKYKDISEDDWKKVTDNKEKNIYYIGKVFAPTTVTDAKNDSLASKPIYLEVQGWALASFPTNSYLVKHINQSWPTANNGLFNDAGNPWNSSDYHRSFWGINPGNMTYNFYSFNEIISKGNKPSYTENTATGYNSIYTQENANPASDTGNNGLAPEAPTQVIFVGKLGELKDGKVEPITLCEFRGKQYTREGVVQLICNDLNLYTDANCTQKVKPEDLHFITQQEWLNLGFTLDPNPSSAENGSGDSQDPSQLPGQGFATRDEAPSTSAKAALDSKITAETLHGATPGRYYSFLVPKDANKEWYRLVGGQPEKIKANIAQFIYESLNYARIKVWEGGQTYFFHDIKHLGKSPSPAEIGVVRNHIYDVKFNKIWGFGTPVLNPNEPIYPEVPVDEVDDVEVTINILSWRLVSQDYEVSW